ncbi:MAG: DUF2064 domain-containing protein [Leptospiraceae bacterium]|nr:DUF2064 domain-containing protein [Leptospiraceae bacterium]MCP5495970.1 DUF2064 domain-containing protein [Leptospiraceae bacterium]
MNGSVAVFVKTSSISPVKTRLALTMGKEKSEQIYKVLVKYTELICREIRKRQKVSTYWAVAEEDQINNPIWKNMDRIWTGEGGLGERMENVYNRLLEKHDFVILIGADCPQLSYEVLLAACNSLDTIPFVVGPSFDGGFYLFGGKLPLTSTIWIDTPYSKSNTREIFCSKIMNNTSFRIVELPMLYDIDTEGDLMNVLPLLSKPIQKKLLHIISQRSIYT